jgi:hypothetical protein
MPYYYAYQVDDDGHIIGRFNLYAENDEEAVAKARQRPIGISRSGTLTGKFPSSNAQTDSQLRQ